MPTRPCKPTSLWRAAWLCLLLPAGAFAADQPAVEDGAACVSRQATAQGKAALHNRCSSPASVYYCSASGDTWGRQACGGGKGASVYYTHLRMLPAGKSTTFELKDSDVRIAVCMNQRSPYDNKGFTSDASGQHQCPPPAQVSEPVAEAYASDSSAEAACTAARELFPPAQRISGEDCRCEEKTLASGRSLHFCRVWGRAAPKDPDFTRQMIRNIRDWQRDALQCDPATDAGQCRRRVIRDSGGVRG